jgi:hypothetical protein
MPRVYELPTHLEVEDQLIAGLTARQLLRLLVFASLAFAAWDQLRPLPDEGRIAMAAVLAGTGVVIALVRPADRSLDQWFLAWLLFVATPRYRVWRSISPVRVEQQQTQANWAELEVDPDWLPTVLDQSERRAAVSQPNTFSWFDLCRPWLSRRRRWTA